LQPFLCDRLLQARQQIAIERFDGFRLGGELLAAKDLVGAGTVRPKLKSPTSVSACRSSVCNSDTRLRSQSAARWVSAIFRSTCSAM
jgi:hypothetical protein